MPIDSSQTSLRFESCPGLLHLRAGGKFLPWRGKLLTGGRGTVTRASAAIPKHIVIVANPHPVTVNQNGFDYTGRYVRLSVASSTCGVLLLFSLTLRSTGNCKTVSGNSSVVISLGRLSWSVSLQAHFACRPSLPALLCLPGTRKSVS